MSGCLQKLLFLSCDEPGIYVHVNSLVNDSNYFRKAPMASGGVWHGMTIRDILEKVDLFNITTVEEDTRKEKKEFSPMALGNYSTNEDLDDYFVFDNCQEVMCPL